MKRLLLCASLALAPAGALPAAELTAIVYDASSAGGHVTLYTPDASLRAGFGSGFGMEGAGGRPVPALELHIERPAPSLDLHATEALTDSHDTGHGPITGGHLVGLDVLDHESALHTHTGSHGGHAHTGRQHVHGHEVGRTATPEPNALPLLGLLAGGAGVLAVRRLAR